jgi:amino acid transporter
MATYFTISKTIMSVIVLVACLWILVVAGMFMNFLVQNPSDADGVSPNYRKWSWGVSATAVASSSLTILFIFWRFWSVYSAGLRGQAVTQLEQQA